MTSNRALRRTSTIVAAAALAALALTACSNSQQASTLTSSPTTPNAAYEVASTSAAPAADADLSGKTFTSATVTGHTLVEGSNVTMNFEDGNVSVQAGCNNMFGGYTLEGSTLNVPLLAGTMMACEQPLMEQDQWISGFLAAGPKATVTPTSLTLASGDTTIVFDKG